MPRESATPVGDEPPGDVAPPRPDGPRAVADLPWAVAPSPTRPWARGVHQQGWWPMATFDRDGRIVDINQLMADLLGRERDDLLGTPIVDAVDPGIVSTDREAYDRLLAGDPIVRYRREMPVAGGRRWKGEVALSLARDAAGDPALIHVRLTEDGGREPPPRLAGREGDLGITLDEMRVGIAVIGLDGRLLHANRALTEITGRSEAELRGLDLLELSHPADRQRDVELGTRAWVGEIDSYTLEKRLIRPDGSTVWVQQEITFARDEDGELVHLIGQVVDITDRKAIELELERSRKELDDLVSHMPIGLLSSDGNGRIVTANQAAADIAGLDVIPPGFLVTEIVYGPDVPALNAEVLAHILTGTDYHVEFRIVRPDGSLRWIRNDARPELDDEGRLIRISGTWLDTTEIKAVEEEMRRHAAHDALTGLVNRRVVFDILAGCVGRCERDPRHVRLTVLFVDLDGFKAINDAHGHGVGDDLLVEVSSRLAIAVGDAGPIGRFGGDEFVVCIEDGHGDDLDAHDTKAEDVAQRIIDAIGRPFTVRDDELSIGASVGVASWRRGQTADDLISSADLGVYAAKRSGRSRWSRV